MLLKQRRLLAMNSLLRLSFVIALARILLHVERAIQNVGSPLNFERGLTLRVCEADRHLIGGVCCL